jgi:enoyl-CoA hydratase/carnithine racemase
VIRLSRPEVHNVVDDRVMEGLESALGRIESNAASSAFVLTAEGDRTFCAGGDLEYFSTLETADRARSMSRRMQVILARIHEGPRFAIAAVNGSAYGGGCEILTACHYRVASRAATFQLRQASMGVVTGWGGGLRLFRLLGRSRALGLLLGGDEIDAGEALRVGFVDRVVEPGGELEEALALARRVNEKPPEAVRAFLELARLAEEEPPEVAAERETERFVELWESAAFREAVERFRNRGRGGK